MDNLIRDTAQELLHRALDLDPKTENVIEEWAEARNIDQLELFEFVTRQVDRFADQLALMPADAAAFTQMLFALQVGYEAAAKQFAAQNLPPL